jgi:hypothetical protein
MVYACSPKHEESLLTLPYHLVVLMFRACSIRQRQLVVNQRLLGNLALHFSILQDVERLCECASADIPPPQFHSRF